VKDDRLYLIHIQECIKRIDKYTGKGREGFMSDTMVQDSVIRNLQTLAESATRMSAPAKESCREVDWKGITGFRNVLVHDYLGVDLERIWLIIQRDIPVLKTAVERLLK